MEPRDFEAIETGLFEPSALSPVVPDDAETLAIAGPRRISLEIDGRLPICGTYRVGAPRFNLSRSFLDEIVLVAVDASTHEPRSGNLRSGDMDSEPGGFDERDPGFAETLIRGWFNVDLFAIVDLPRRPGRYHVFATVGDLKSAVIVVEVTA
jgi:hypothetical protein